MINKNKKENRIVRFFKPYSTKQLVWFVIGALLNLTGLSFIITNIIGDNLNVAPTKNPIIIADTALKNGLHTPLGFLYWGIIFLLLGALIVSLTLSLASRNEDRDRERSLRREQRLKQMMDASDDVVINSSVNENPNSNGIKLVK